jgi:class 3 adenylate cyclase/tetratricopeptide (TPR) repeat protein
MRCPICQHENPISAKFCVECGARLEVRCSGCGILNPASAKFCQECGGPLAPKPDDTRRLAAGSSATDAPREERRWATVLFADLSGFTTMAEQMDAEDVKALAHRCAERMSKEVRRFGGTVLNVVGDQVVAVFGAPVSHEDDAERAVRAGLAIRDCSLAQSDGEPIRVHVGINTGEVMAGFVGPQERRDYTVMGDTVNLAARLMGVAPAATVLVGEETWRATRRTVRCRELPPVAVKGKQRPLPVWEALEASALAAVRPLGTAPLVGRDEELALLSGIWLKVVRESRPHLVTVLGEPGIGKSRLVAEFENRFCADAQILHGRCLPYGEVLGYWALTTALKEAAGITAELGSDTARFKLNDLVHHTMTSDRAESDFHGDADELSRHLALLSGLDSSNDSAARPADQRILHASLRRFLEALARQKPLCLLLEDIHWADDALLDLIEFLASRAREAPLLIVTQARPELLQKRPNWGGGVRAYTSLAIEPLSQDAARELILALCRERDVPEKLAAEVGRGASGNPLFAEELVAMIAERGCGTGVPSAIKALISARLDTLPAAERTALQLAAVFGKTFWRGGLESLGADPQLAALLESLEQKDFVRGQPGSQFRGDSEYAFKHDLIRDVAYETLPRAERRLRHGQIADWIERVAGEQLETYFDQLAHHALSAAQDQRALDYLLRAADRARRTAAHRQEAALLGQAVEIAAHLNQVDRLAELHARRGKAFIQLNLWAEARVELGKAVRFLAPDRQQTRAEILTELAAACFWMFDIPQCRQAADEALQAADATQRNDLAAVATGWLGAAEQSEKSIRTARPIYRRALERDPGIAGAPLALYCLNLYLGGEAQEAVAVGEEALRRFRARNDTSNTMFAFPHLGLALAGCGRYADAARIFEEARRFGREYEVPRFLARSVAMSAGFHLDLFDFPGHEALAEEARELGQVGDMAPSVVSAGIDLLLNFARQGAVSRAERLIDPTTRAVVETGGWHEWLWKLRLAQAQAELALARQDWQECLRWADQVIAASQAKARVKYEALGLWAKARALHALGRTSEAIADLRTAHDVARRIQDPALALRVACARLALAGDDELLAETRVTAKQILDALPSDEMRHHFLAAKPVQELGHLTS